MGPSCRPPPQLGTFQSYRNFLQRAGIVLHTAPAVWAPKFSLPLAFTDLSCPFKHFTWTATCCSASIRAHLKLLGVYKQNPIFACLQIQCHFYNATEGQGL